MRAELRLRPKKLDRSLNKKRGWSELFGREIDWDSTSEVFRQIYLQIRSAIVTRRLDVGTKLPSTRVLAADLRVSRTSVISAYEQLLAEGYVSGKIGSGTYISADFSDAADAVSGRDGDRASAGRPPPAARAKVFADIVVPSTLRGASPFDAGCALIDARTAQVWNSLSRQALVRIDPVHLSYSDPRGLLELRTEICGYLRAARAVKCDPDQIIVTSGTQQALDIAIRVLLDTGDKVWIEDPCYELTYQALASYGMKIQPIPIDREGLNVAEGLRSSPTARVVFVTPSHQHPLGVVLSMPRRLELLAWARENRSWIVEDDYDSEFRYSGRPLASLQGLDDSDRVIYLGTFSKSLFPGLRLGYAVVPHSVAKAFIGARYLIDRHPPTLSQVVLAEFMRAGHYSSHIRRVRLAYAKARDTLLTELKVRAGAALSLEPPNQGRHVTAYLSEGRSDIAVARAAQDKGVTVRPISKLYRKVTPKSGLILGFAGFESPAIVRGAAALAEVIRAVQVRRK